MGYAAYAFRRGPAPPRFGGDRSRQIDFATSFGFDPGKTTRRIRVTAPDLCTPLFTGLISALAERAPLASVEFIQGGLARQAVLRSEADTALGFGHP